MFVMLPNYSKTSKLRSCPVIRTRTHMSGNSFSTRRYYSARCFLLYSGPHLPRSSGQRVVAHPATASSSSLSSSTTHLNDSSSIFQHSTFCAPGICDTRRTKINLASDSHEFDGISNFLHCSGINHLC